MGYPKVSVNFDSIHTHFIIQSKNIRSQESRVTSHNGRETAVGCFRMTECSVISVDKF